jgi:hypothetical protein
MFNSGGIAATIPKIVAVTLRLLKNSTIGVPMAMTNDVVLNT